MILLSPVMFTLLIWTVVICVVGAICAYIAEKMFYR